jgi:glycosyltransferase involved in cell wall biosynthesis
VYDTHELETEVAGGSAIRRGLARLLERLCLNAVDQVFCVSDAITEWYRVRAGRDDATTILNVPAPAPGPVLSRAAVGLPDQARVFLYQGLMARGRGLPLVVRAFQALPGDDLALLLVGFGPLRDELAQLAAGDPRIQVLDAVPPDELAPLTRAADVGLSVIEPVSLSYEYCMPNKLFEYVQAGLPVIVSPTREQSGFVTRHGVGEVVRELTVEGVREAMRRVLSTPRELWRVRCAACSDAVSWEREADRMLDVYRARLGVA